MVGGSQQRRFSVKAIHSVFPASLTYYSPRTKSNLFDHQEIENRPHDVYDEGVIIAKDGLVYPGVQKYVSNGAALYPNTFTQQEYIRRYFDEFLDRAENDEDVDTPHIFTIPKGTPIPNQLILINEYLARFSLQPSYGMPLRDLNQRLNDFWDESATKETAEEWLDKHPFDSAMTDDGDQIWREK
ncbi:hypothetical protein Purlil1_13807 [Purpureocillium lilacinum]|uniref:Tse2 ADP-ribosyltransferase toxin domain-containing protein n=1 Tax=Purpureocillium lilacinum TaxID=33203 RepID=A0ABR0BD39_PURLI|nr:hypothetical protein Purlil1_13807 [Purpureocillium lilacinum]